MTTQQRYQQSEKGKETSEYGDRITAKRSNLMAMNKVKQGSQRYPWVTHTWNVVKGKCPHDCSYCYMKRYPQPKLHFDEKSLSNGLGDENTIFVGSSCDMWASFIPNQWIERTIFRCFEYNKNHYLFQSKNPIRFLDYTDIFPDNVWLGTTIETNRHYDFISLAPNTDERRHAIQELNYPIMISIEPIMDFDLDVMVKWIQDIAPHFVSIGADSGNNNLPEPSSGKTKALISALKEITEVKVKDNLSRLLEGEVIKESE